MTATFKAGDMVEFFDSWDNKWIRVRIVSIEGPKLTYRMPDGGEGSISGAYESRVRPLTNTQPAIAYSPVAEGVEVAPTKGTGIGTVVKHRYAVAGRPFDTAMDYSLAPSSRSYVYGTRRMFYLAPHGASLAVVWEDRATSGVQLTTIDPHTHSYATIELPSKADEDLAAAAMDEAGNIYYLTINPGNGDDDSDRPATLTKADSAGNSIVSVPLNTSTANGLDMTQFGDRNVASMQYMNGQLGVIIGRQMHRNPDDGLQHQGGIALVFDANTLQLIKHHGQTSGHSFENVLTTGPQKFVGIDLGDNYPRGVHLHSFDGSGIQSRVVFTFKTEHGTQPQSPAGTTYEPYIKNFFKWSNDNQTYTELGGVVPGEQGYTVIFTNEVSPDGKSILNDRVGMDARNIGLVQVSPSFMPYDHRGSECSVPDGVIISQGPEEQGGFYTFGGDWSEQRNVGVRWLTKYTDREKENAARLKTAKLPNGNILLVWETWNTDDYVNTYAMIVTEAGEVVVTPQELGPLVRLNRRDDMLVMDNTVYLASGAREEQKLEITAIQLNA